MKLYLPVDDKIKIIKRVIEGNEDVSKVAREFNVSRKAIYAWIKLYKNSANRNKTLSLLPKYNTGKDNLLNKTNDIKSGVIRLVVANPLNSIRDYSLELAKRGVSVSPSTIYMVLKNLSIETSDRRENFAKDYAGPGRLSTNVKAEVVNQVKTYNKNITDVAREYNVSRKAIYKWIRDVDKFGDENSNFKDALQENYIKGENHPKFIGSKFEDAILQSVRQNPDLGIRDIAKLANTTNYLAWRTLRENNLALKSQRLLYSQKYLATPEVQPSTGISAEIPKSQLDYLTPNLMPGPPPRGGILSNLAPFTISAFITLLITSGFIYLLIVVLKASSFVAMVGMSIAAVSLSMGTIFFLYSIKYYLTLIIVLSYQNKKQSFRGNLLFKIFGISKGEDPEVKSSAFGIEPDLTNIKLVRKPFVSIHIPFYNEKNVVERAIQAAVNFKYPEYEIILADDSTDETSSIIREYQESCLFKNEALKVTKGEGWEMTEVEVKPGVVLKHLHRTSREGYKGKALSLALTLTNPKAEYISVFDADFVPYPDTLDLFLKYFQISEINTSSQLGIGDHLKFGIGNSRVAAVQGYQWHVLNKSENWITRGVRSEYAGSYVVERSGAEIYGGLKQISGSVYMIKRDVLAEIGWGTSITEDFELTLKLYEAGYKVLYTPYIQAPAECVSTLKRLVRQRMRWAEGHSFNVKKMFKPLMLNPKVSFSEKLEFAYLAPYYLQAFFFLIGTLSWLISETVFKVKLPFWTELWGWSLVLTNLISLPLLNSVGLFLEESERKDYGGIGSFIALSYLLVPFQAYAAIKGFMESQEGPWFRTPKTGRITDILARSKFMRFIEGFIPGKANGTVPYTETDNYLALESANSRFDKFDIRRSKNRRWVGKSFLAVLLIVSNIIISIAPGVPYFVKPADALAQSFGIVNTPDDKKADKSKYDKGVIVLNTNKLFYTPGETARLEIGAIDAKGDTLCSANLSLEVTDPIGITETYKVAEGSINKSSTCSPDNNVTDNPDYFVNYKVSIEGNYEYKLTNQENGLTTDGKFEVKKDLALSIERIGSSRINPSEAVYEMTIKIKANKDYKGELTDNVPASFKIIDRSDNQLRWNVNLKKGDIKTYQYIYQAPEISPELYKIGPLTLSGDLGIDFSKLQPWQIASDSIVSYPVTTSTAGAGTNQSSSSHTIADGPNRLLVVAISTEDTVDADRVISSVTWNSTETLTAAQNQQNDTSNVAASIYYLVNPTATTANVVVNFAGNVTSIGVTVFKLYNAAQTSVLDTNNGANQNNTATPNVSVTTNYDYSYVISVDTNNANTALTSTQTEKSDFSISGARMVTEIIQKDSAGSQNMGYTAGGATDDHAQAVAAFKTVPNSIHMIGSVTTSTAGAGTNQSSFSYTVPSTGSNRALVVAVSTEDTVDADRVISSITWNTTESLTAARNQQNDTSNVGANIYYLVNPTATTANIVVNFAGNVTSIGVTAMTLNNINQSSPTDAVNGANQDNTATPNVSVTTNYDYSFLVSVDANNAATALTSTQDEKADFGISGAESIVSVLQGGAAGSHNIGYTGGGGTNDHAQAASAFRLYVSATVTLSGKIYTDEGSTLLDCTSGRTVNLRVNGAGSYSTTCSNSPTNGSWSIASVSLATNDIVSVYLDEASEDATTVYKSDVTAKTDINIYQNTVIVRSDTGTSIIPDNLYAADDGNNDIRYSVSAASNGNLTVESNFELHVWTGSTFDASGGTVTTQGTGSIHIDDSATLTMDTSGNVIAGDLVVDDSATANINNSTTINGGDITVTSGGDVASTAGTVTMGASGTIGGGSTGSVFQLTNLTVSSGTTTLGADDDNILLFSGDISISSGATLAMNSKTADVTGGNLTTTGTGSVTCSACSAGGLTISGDGSTNGIGGGSGGITLYNLTLDDTTNTTAIGTSTITILNNLTIGANRTLSGYSSGTINVAGDWSNSGTFTANSGTVVLNGAGGSTQTISGTNSFYTLSATGSSARTIKFPSSVTTTVTNSLTLSGAASQLLTLAPSTASTTWTIAPSGSISVSYVSVSYSTSTVCIQATNSNNGGNNVNWTYDGSSCPISANTQYSFQRKTWWDGTRYWRSYQDQTNSRIRFDYSTDGSSWTENTSAQISVNTADFSIEADSSNLFIVYTSSNDIKGRVGSSYPGTGFGWGSEQVVLNGTGATDDYSYPVISRDSSSYVWVGAKYTGSGVYYVKTIKETGGANDLPEDSGDTVYSLADSANSNSNVLANIVSTGSSNMYAVFTYGTSLQGCKWVNASTQWQFGSGSACTGSGGWYNASWNYRIKLTIDNTKVDADLTDFPVYVDLSNMPSAFFTHVNQTDCRDIRVTKGDGTTELPREIVSCNPGGSTGELHFKYSGTLSGSSDTDVYIYYGNSGASDYAVNDTYGVQNVWDTDYKAVWHLNETSGSFLDSTANNNDGSLTDANSNSTRGYGGKMGGSVDFNGDADYIDINPTSNMPTDAPLTIELWLNKDTTTIGSPFAARSGSFVMSEFDNTQINFEISGVQDNYLTHDVNEGTWEQYVYTWSAASGKPLTYYRNTSQLRSADANVTPAAGTNRAFIGAHTTSTWFLDGKVDEVRVSGSVRSTTWLSTDYNNQNAPSTFFNSWGSEQTPTSSSDSIAIVTAGISANLSAVSDSSGNVHLIYIDSAAHTVYREYTSSWQTAVTLDSNSGNSYVSMTLDTSNDGIYAFWVRSNHIYYSHSVSPYTSGNWDVSPTDWKSGTNITNLTSNYSENGKIFAEWLDSAAINWDIIAVPENLWLLFSLGIVIPIYVRRKRKTNRASIVYKS